MAKSDEEKKVIYETKVRVNLLKLRDIVAVAREESLKVGGKPMTQGGGTKEQRSKFHTFNTINKFLERVDNGEDFIILPVSGTVSGVSQRIYHDPSITSLAKPFRACLS